MAVYLGDQGSIEIKRDSLNAPLSSALDPGDVNVDKRRFSFDFDPAALITGDQIDIETADSSDLVLIKGHTGDSWRGYVHIDDAGGIRAFKTFRESIAGELTDALELTKPSATQNIQVTTRGSLFRCLAEVTQFDLTDSRETVDITSLGEEFRRNYANGLISGQGSANCFWCYRNLLCDEYDEISKGTEFPNYLAQLILRTKLGSDFIGRFVIYSEPGGDSVWQEATCIVTNVSIAIEPTQMIRLQFQFVTTGQIRLHVGEPPSVLLTENASTLTTEDDQGIQLEQGD